MDALDEERPAELEGARLWLLLDAILPDDAREVDGAAPLDDWAGGPLLDNSVLVEVVDDDDDNDENDELPGVETEERALLETKLLALCDELPPEKLEDPVSRG